MIPVRFSNPILFALLLATTSFAAEKPNILWITSEDNGPELGCYGDSYANTPNIDSLAEMVNLSVLTLDKTVSIRNLNTQTI